MVAVEPSEVMLASRPAGAAPAIRASAKALPFADREFDAAMTVLSVHHWSDRRAGLAEMRRVARGPLVVFTRLPDVSPYWWLYDYFPATRRLVAGRETPLAEFAAVVGPVELTPVPIPRDCQDGFEAAYWRRPAALLDPGVWRPMPALALIPDDDRDRGLRRLRADLDTGAWERRWRICSPARSSTSATACCAARPDSRRRARVHRRAERAGGVSYTAVTMTQEPVR